MVKSSSSWIRVLAIFALTLAVSVSAAHAGPQFQISDGVTTVTVVDNGPGDSDPTVGVILYAPGGGGPFPGLLVTIDTGISKPVHPFPGTIDLNAVEVTSTSAGAQDFILKLSDTDFSFPQFATQLAMSLGGTLGGPAGSTITFDGYEDNTNTIFGTSGLHVGPGTFGPGAFSGTFLAGSFPVAPYSLTEIVSIHFTGFGVTTFDTELRVVPEPATLTLLGLGILGLGACTWRRRKGEGAPTR
jgi:hypothetical protein